MAAKLFCSHYFVDKDYDRCYNKNIEGLFLFYLLNWKF